MQQEKYRKVRICPVTGCGCLSRSELSTLRSEERRGVLLAAAKPAPRTKYIPQVHLQQNLLDKAETSKQPSMLTGQRATRSLEARPNHNTVSVEGQSIAPLTLTSPNPSRLESPSSPCNPSECRWVSTVDHPDH